MGVSRLSGRAAITSRRKIPNKTLREYYLAHRNYGLTLGDLARRADVDSGRAARAMGLRAESRRDEPQEFIEDHFAARLALAMNLDPRDVGA